jgi:hypothetical protein
MGRAAGTFSHKYLQIVKAYQTLSGKLKRMNPLFYLDDVQCVQYTPNIWSVDRSTNSTKQDLEHVYYLSY